MFDRENRLFELTNTVCAIGEDSGGVSGGGEVGGGESVGDAGGGDSAGVAAAEDAGSGESMDAGQQHAEGDGQVDDVASAAQQTITPDVVERLIQERVQQALQGAQYEPPAYVRQLLEQQQTYNQVLNQLFEQAQQAQQRKILEDSRPKPPPPDAPTEEHMAFLRRDLAWQHQQSMARMEQMFTNQVRRLESLVESQAKRLEQAQHTAAMEAYQARVNNEIAHLVRQPGMSIFAKEGPKAVLRTVHAAMLEANPNITLAQAAQMLSAELGLTAPTQQAQNAARREMSIEALKQQRASVQKRTGPIPGAQGGKAPAPKKSTVETARKVLALGHSLPQELKDHYGLN